jgi:DNA-binding CsgD family transcriptional regulator
MADYGHASRLGQVFVGRGPELALLESGLAAARAGQPRVVLVEGEAGMGKSALVNEFVSQHPDAPTIFASGEESEAVLPYGVVAQFTAGAAAVSSRALAGLRLLNDGIGPETDPLAVGVELLAVISAIQHSAPVVLVVEDLQWADLASARSLLFAFRRLGADHVLAVLTYRASEWATLGEGWTRFASGDRHAIALTLAGLDVGELGQLCRALGRTGVPERSLRRIAEHTGGNPLLARALLSELSDEALTASEGPLRAPRSLASLTAARLAGMSVAARDLVVAAAVLGERSSLADLSAVAAVAAPGAALAEAERAGFLVERPASAGWEVTFTHLLIRQSVYHDLGAQRRRRWHRRAAEVVGGPEALEHRAAAAAAADSALAAELAAAAAVASRDGKPQLAARYLRQAASVTEPGPTRDEFTLSWYEQLVLAADVAGAERARPLLERLPASARRDAAMGYAAVLAARPREGEVLLRAAWAAHDPLAEADIGAEAAVSLGTMLVIWGSFAESGRWLDRALDGACGGERWFDAARCIRALVFTLDGQATRAFQLFADLPARAAMVPTKNTDALSYRGAMRLWTDDLDAAAEDLTRAVARITAGQQVRYPCQALGMLAETEFRIGRWDDARGHAELAVSLARDADRDLDLPFVHSVAVPVAACRGDWAAADMHVRAAVEGARAFGGLAAMFAASACGVLGLAKDDPAEVLRGVALALAVSEVDRYDDPASFWWRPMQTWALIRSGDLDGAETVLAAFHDRAAARSTCSPLLHAAWLGGSLAMRRGDLDRADEILVAGRRDADHLPFPLLRGLMALEHGRCLATLRRPREAISALNAAHEAFAGLGAVPFARASQAELSALGLRASADGDPDLPGLTTQELRVARLVLSGLSNRQVAIELYLSPKTVEFHLANVYAKLGVRSRHELAARIGARAHQHG